MPEVRSDSHCTKIACASQCQRSSGLKLRNTYAPTCCNFLPRLRSSHSQLLSFVGWLKELVLPSDDELLELVQRAFKDTAR